MLSVESQKRNARIDRGTRYLAYAGGLTALVLAVIHVAAPQSVTSGAVWGTLGGSCGLAGVVRILFKDRV